MLRIVIGRPGPEDEPSAVVALARALRDAGHEVIHAGPQDEAEALAAAAVQEDADVVALLTGDEEEARGTTDLLLGLLGSSGADEVLVVAGRSPAEVLAGLVDRG
jgi:methylmalonyl-CoA mutase C-terminal domain/subunit